jgi:hypothetical protein
MIARHRRPCCRHAKRRRRYASPRECSGGKWGACSWLLLGATSPIGVEKHP